MLEHVQRTNMAIKQNLSICHKQKALTSNLLSMREIKETILFSKEKKHTKSQRKMRLKNSTEKRERDVVSLCWHVWHAAKDNKSVIQMWSFVKRIFEARSLCDVAVAVFHLAFVMYAFFPCNHHCLWTCSSWNKFLHYLCVRPVFSYTYIHVQYDNRSATENGERVNWNVAMNTKTH